MASSLSATATRRRWARSSIRGDVVSTGARSRVEITIPDGGIYRLGPNSKMQCNGQTTFVPEGRRDNFKLILGSMWAAISDALGGSHEFEQQDRTVAVGVRGSAFTASVQPGGAIVYHVIAGTGFIRVKGRKEFDYPAGEGVRFDPGYADYTLTTAWPAADQALVPATQRPPRLSGVRLSGARAGKRATLHFTLSQNARITVQIQRGTHRVSQQSTPARRGTRTIRLKALPRGRYTLTVFATVQKRSVALQESFRVR